MAVGHGQPHPGRYPILNRGRKSSSRRGVLLLEALLTIVILAGTLSVLIESMLSGLRTTLVSADYMKAVWLAENKMFELLAKKAVASDYREQGTFPDFSEKYQYAVSTRPREIAPQVLSSEVTLKVFWTVGSLAREVSDVTCLLSAVKEK